MKLSQNFIDFLEANPYDQVRYLFHLFKCRMLTFIYRSGFWISLFLGKILLEKAGFYILVYSGCLKNMFDKGLVTVSDVDEYIVKYGYPSQWLGYGDRLRYPWSHTFTRIAVFFRVYKE